MGKPCEVKGCVDNALPKRCMCDRHAFPMEHKSERRLAIEAQKKRKAKVLA